ncbi:hypothetical protein OSB04_028256 [Centaurea solstitialis]|uniref:Uncharacterized protein n=1 Tax=Centaurea solstitialis TaxID=347529 RepID=A0AA38SSU9_9ASTR|nr:hypothetical protein OSB04_028256 [Centaurea solstitialis]
MNPNLSNAKSNQIRIRLEPGVVVDGGSCSGRFGDSGRRRNPRLDRRVGGGFCDCSGGCGGGHGGGVGGGFGDGGGGGRRRESSEKLPDTHKHQQEYGYSWIHFGEDSPFLKWYDDIDFKNCLYNQPPPFPACTRNHHHPRLYKQQTPPLPSSQLEYIWQQQKNTIDVPIDAGAFVTWANILFNPNSIQPTITTFTTAALVPATTTMFKTLPRHATLLPSKIVIITNNTSSNFTTGNALVMQLHVYLKAAVCIHVIGWLLD